jgi:hypothetical protein
MTIGTLSLDPRRVLAADIEYYRGRWILSVKYMVGNAMTEFDTDYEDHEDAMAALVKLDGVCYKGPLADAVADKTIDDDQDDEDYEIGFFREKT